MLVTTRRHDAALHGPGLQLVDVDLFSHHEAVTCLAGRLAPSQLEQAGELVEDLGRLPLALAQAAACMGNDELSCAGYRQRLARVQLAEAFPEDALADDYEATVARTWTLSITAADQLPPKQLASRVLTVATLLDPNGIPTQLFTTDTARTFLTGAGPPNRPRKSQRFRLFRGHRRTSRGGADSPPVSADDARRALHNLRRLSLITFSGQTAEQKDAGGGVVLVHGLVQRVVRETLAPDQLARAARAGADGLVECWPDMDYQPELALLTQSLRVSSTLLETYCPAALWTAQAHPVLFQAGRSLRSAGLLAQTVAYWEQPAATAAHQLGADHPDTLASRGNLASAYRDVGRLTEAIPLFERTLADRERLLGADHPAVAVLLYQLGMAELDLDCPQSAVQRLRACLMWRVGGSR